MRRAPRADRPGRRRGCRRRSPPGGRARLAAGFAACLLAGGLATRARAEIVERVVAVVNEDAIFLSELRQRSAPFLPQVMRAATQVERMALLEQVYGQVLGQLIADELIRQAAAAMELRVSRPDIDRAIANVQRQSGLDDDGFWEAVRAQGFTEAQYRNDVRRQLLRLKVLNQRARGRVNVTEDDVRAEYDRRVRQRNSRLRFRAAHVFLRVPEGATATDVAAIRRRAQVIYDGLTHGTFDQAVAEHGGGELGWLEQGELPQALDDTLAGMQPGSVAPPVRGPGGFHILKLYEREHGTGELGSYGDLREQIFREMMEQAMGRQERLMLEELERDAIIERRL